MNSNYLFDGQFPFLFYVIMLSSFAIIALIVSRYLHINICDMHSTELCDYYYFKYKEKCRYRMSHNVFCIRDVIKNGL